MSLKGAAIFAGATRGMRNAAKNLRSIQEAREKRRQETELFDLKKQEADLKIKQLKASGQKSAMETKIFSKLLDEQYKTQDTIGKGKDAMIDMAEQEERTRAKGFADTARGLMDDPDVNFLLTGVFESLPKSSVAQNVNTKVPQAKKRGFFEDFAPTLSASGKPGVRRKTEKEVFTESFKQAETGQMTFDQLETQFPGKRKEIKEQRIAGLPEKSQRLLSQIDREIIADEKAAEKEGTISNPENVISDFLIEIVENREQAERAGHNVNEILDILGVTEQEVRENQPEPSKGFLEKIKELYSLLTPLGAAKALTKGN